MIRPGKIMILLLFSFAFHSCFKEDEMVTPHPRGDVRTDTISMTENYLFQVYFDLNSGKVVSSDVKTSTDLGFECSEGGWHVILNTSDFMKVSDLGEVTFGQAYDTTGLKMHFDKSDGNPDSNAIGQWFTVTGNDTVSNRHVYAVSRGMDELGNPLGLYQVIFDSLKGGSYYFRYTALSGGNISAGNVRKDPAVNYIFFNLKSGNMVSLEPPKQTYDLLFTQYTTMLYTDLGIPYPYLVTGVLLNRYKVEAIVDSTTDFQSITLDKAMKMQFSGFIDALGYDWKYYNFTTGVYTIRPNLNYIIHGVSGFYYKLRFVGFYNKEGLKGYPVIEYQLL